MLDDLDHKLIAALREDSRSPVALLARECGVNRATVTARIDRLRQTGVIEAFTIRLRHDVDHDAIRGVSMISLQPNQGQAVIRKVRGFPEVEGVYSTIGVWDLVVQLKVNSLAEFDLALERIRSLPGVKETQTSLLFNALTRGS